MKFERLLSIKKEWSTIKFRGVLLVETILASALFVLLITALTSGYLYGQAGTAQTGNRVKAIAYAESGMEAVRNIRNADFAYMTNGTYGLTYSSGKWAFASSTDTSGIFSRSITITSSSSPDIKDVTVTVTWPQEGGRTGNVTLTRTFTNWLDTRNWYTPGVVSTTTLAAGGDKIKLQGNYAYVIGYSSSILYVVDITSSTSPKLLGSVALTGTIYNLDVSGNYVYVTSDSNSKELQVINVSNKSAPVVAGSYNAPGNSFGIGVYILGNKLYMTRKNSAQDQFLALSLANPTNPTLLGSIDLGADGYGLVASGTYAYVSTNKNSAEFQVIDISNPASMSLVGSVDVSHFAQSGVDEVTLQGNYVYIGQGTNFYVIDVSNPSAPSLKNVTSVVDAFNDISSNLGNKGILIGKYIFVGTSDSNKEFKVYDVGSSTNPVIYGTSLDIAGNTPVYGIAYATSTNLVYAVTHSTTNSFFTIAP